MQFSFLILHFIQLIAIILVLADIFSSGGDTVLSSVSASLKPQVFVTRVGFCLFVCLLFLYV